MISDGAFILGPDGFSKDDFDEFVVANQTIGFDCETTKIDDTLNELHPDARIRLAQFGNENTAFVLDMTNSVQRNCAINLLSSDWHTFVTHSSYDVRSASRLLGVDFLARYVDTLVLARTVYPETNKSRKRHGQSALDTLPNSAGLKDLCAFLLDDGLSIAENDLHDRMRELRPSGVSVSEFDGWSAIDTNDESYVRYAGLDAIYVFNLWQKLLDIQSENAARLIPLEQWLNRQGVAMTMRGMKLDVEFTRELLDKYGAENEQARAAVIELTGCKPGSKFLAEWFEQQGVEFTERTEKGAPSLAKDVLPDLCERYSDGIVGEAFRKLTNFSATKNLATNTKTLLEYAAVDGRLHPEIKTQEAVTGRMSVTHPALQTMASGNSELRQCFIADDGFTLLSADMKQVEPRIAAALAGETALIERMAAGLDPYSAAAEITGKPRKTMKATILATLYGAGVGRIMDQAQLTRESAKEAQKFWRDAAPNISEFSRELANLDEFVLTPFGRRIPVDPERGYKNINSLVQSSARDLFVSRVFSLRRLAGLMLMWVHDELLFQVPTEQLDYYADLIRDAVTFVWFGAPFGADIEIGHRWGDMVAYSPPALGLTA